MEKIAIISCWLILLVGWGITGCKKDVVAPGDAITGNRAPVAVAGRSGTIYYPASTVMLDGKDSRDPDNNLAYYQWKLIKGSSNGLIISDSDKIKTTVSGLHAPVVYEFELMVIDGRNLFSKDTVIISVADTAISYGNNEIIFRNRKWIEGWPVLIEIHHLPLYLPPNSAIKSVFIKRDSSTNWERVIPWNSNPGEFGINHEWQIQSGVFAVYRGNNLTDDTPDIKILY